VSVIKPYRPELEWSRPWILSNAYRRLFSQGEIGRSVKRTIHFHEISDVKSVWCRTSIPLYVFMVRCILILRDNLSYANILSGDRSWYFALRCSVLSAVVASTLHFLVSSGTFTIFTCPYWFTVRDDLVRICAMGHWNDLLCLYWRLTYYFIGFFASWHAAIQTGEK
jgi:hypothetical protein